MREIRVLIFGLLCWAGFVLAVEKFYASIKSSARKEQPREDGDTLEFFVTPRMRLLVQLVLVLLIAFMVLVVTTSGGSILALLIPMTVFFLILLAKPAAVTINTNGIQQARWLLPDKEIKWGEICSVAFGKNTGTTYVLSKGDGPKIRFSPFLVGRSRFEREVRAHVGNMEMDESTEDQ